MVTTTKYQVSVTCAELNLHWFKDAPILSDLYLSTVDKRLEEALGKDIIEVFHYVYNYMIDFFVAVINLKPRLPQ